MTYTNGPSCPRCGKVIYASRKLARRVARSLYPGQSMSEYRCGTGWHIGHTPEYVKAGIAPRGIYGRWR